MSATSNLVGLPAAPEDEVREQRLDTERRRYLMRYVVGALGIAGLICVGAGIRLAVSRSASHDDALPPPSPLITESVAAPAAPPAEPAKAEPIPAPAAALAAPPDPTTAAPTETPAPAPAAASKTTPVAAAPAKHAVLSAPPAPAPRSASNAQSHPKPHGTGIIHAAPF